MNNQNKLISIVIATYFFIGNLSAQNATYQPVSQADCKEIQTKLEKAIKAKLKMSPSKSHYSGNGNGCMLEGKKLNTNDIESKIKNALRWEDESQYNGAGPTSMSMGFKKDKKLLICDVSTDNPSTIEIWIGEMK